VRASTSWGSAAASASRRKLEYTPEGQTIIDKLAQLKAGAMSLVRRKDGVPALGRR
jgi:hypothetical protein